MSSSCWRSVSTPGRDGSNDPVPIQPTLASPQMHSVSRIDWSFVDRPAPASATSSGLARLKLVGPEQGAVHTDLAAIGLAAGRLAGAPLPLVRGGAVRPVGRAAGRSRRSGPPARRRRLRADPDRSPARPREHRDGGGALPVAQQPATARSVGAATRHVLRAGAGPRPDGRRRDAARRSATRPSASSATTRARGRRSRRSGSRIRRAAALRRAPTPRSSPTAGSP